MEVRATPLWASPRARRLGSPASTCARNSEVGLFYLSVSSVSVSLSLARSLSLTLSHAHTRTHGSLSHTHISPRLSLVALADQATMELRTTPLWASPRARRLGSPASTCARNSEVGLFISLAAPSLSRSLSLALSLSSLSHTHILTLTTLSHTRTYRHDSPLWLLLIRPPWRCEQRRFGPRRGRGGWAARRRPARETARSVFFISLAAPSLSRSLSLALSLSLSSLSHAHTHTHDSLSHTH